MAALLPERFGPYGFGRMSGTTGFLPKILLEYSQSLELCKCLDILSALGKCGLKKTINIPMISQIWHDL